MNILVGESTESGGNYSLFTETQVLSLTWKADPVETRLISVRDGKEMSVMRSGQSGDTEKAVADATEVVETFKEAINTLGKTKVVDRSDLNALNISEVLNAVPAAAPAEETAETEVPE